MLGRKLLLGQDYQREDCEYKTYLNITLGFFVPNALNAIAY